MAKDNISGIVTLLEYMDRKTAKPATAKAAKQLFKKKKDIDFEELPDYVRKQEEKLKTLKKFMKEFTEEKKPEKKGMKFSGLEWFIIGIISYPIVGPLYSAALTNLHTLSTVVK